MRIDKLLANLGFGSRREIHKDLKKGLVCINGELCKKKDTAVDPSIDTVTYKGELVDCTLQRYIALYKEAGYITATTDRVQATVMDLLPEDLQRLSIFPVGRLDKDTEGLLLLTNDGAWAHRVIHGKKQVPKTYYFTYEGTLDASSEEAVTEGLVLDGTESCKPGTLVLEQPGEGYLTIYEGKYHQVKRMIAQLGSTVTYLKRISIGPVQLDSLSHKGAYRDLEPEEIDYF